ncbi:MAG: hypothetical protein HYX57_04020 [Chloroflexi bacterium]|nr:hypothetical protein [Chloroflexota bacterium]
MQAHVSSAATAPEPAPDAEHQLDLVRSAITLLAAGGARRVTLVNLAISDGTLREASLLARTSGMLLRVATRGALSELTVEASG